MKKPKEDKPSKDKPKEDKPRKDKQGKTEIAPKQERQDFHTAVEARSEGLAEINPTLIEMEANNKPTPQTTDLE